MIAYQDDDRRTPWVRLAAGGSGRRPPPPGGPMQIIDKLIADNHWPGRAGHPIEAVVIHVAEGREPGVTAWFNDPASGASTHYLVCANGVVIRYVREEDTAWANGLVNKPNLADPLIKKWVDGKINPNRRTIAIETERYWRERLTAPQLVALAELVADIHRRHGLPRDGTRILAHSELDGVTRARCPSLSAGEWYGLVAALDAETPQPADLDQALWDEVQAIEQAGYRYLAGLCKSRGTADLSALGGPTSARWVELEKAVIWTADGKRFDAMHPGQLVTLLASGVAARDPR